MNADALRFAPLLLGLALGGALVFVSPALLLGALAGLAFAVAVFRQPLLGLGSYLFVAAFMPYATVHLGIRVTVAELLLLLTWAAVLWRLAGPEGAAWRARLRDQPVLRAAGWWLLFSLVPLAAGWLMVPGPGNAPVNWSRWLMNVSLLWMALLLVPDRATARAVLVPLFMGALASLVLSLSVFAGAQDARAIIDVLTTFRYAHPEAIEDIFSGHYGRLGSPWVHPNVTGGFYALVVPLAYLTALAVGRGWGRRAGFALALLAVAGLLLSGSRGALVALVLVTLWLAFKGVPGTGRIILYGGLAGFLLVVSYPPLQERLVTMFSVENASTVARMDEYRAYPEAIARYPLGIGFKGEPPPPDPDLLGISNLWLNYAYKLGPAGLALFLWVSWRWWRTVRPRVRGDAWRADPLLTGVVAALLVAYATGLFDHYYSFTPVLTGVFWFLTGLSLVLAREAEAEDAAKTKTTRRE